MMKRFLNVTLPSAAVLLAVLGASVSAEQAAHSFVSPFAHPAPQTSFPSSMHGIPASQGASASQGEIDRLLAAAETSEEVRIILSRYDRWKQIGSDVVLKQFLRERFTAPELEASTRLTREYRSWLVETLIDRGEMIDQSGIVPNFRLQPAVQAPSWRAIWNRSFAPYLSESSPDAVAHVVTHGHEHAHLRVSASTNASVAARLLPGTQITVLSSEGDWVRVSISGGPTSESPSGYLLASEVARSTSDGGERYTGPESIVFWQKMPYGTWDGHDSPFGWVYPPYTQAAGAVRGVR